MNDMLFLVYTVERCFLFFDQNLLSLVLRHGGVRFLLLNLVGNLASQGARGAGSSSHTLQLLPLWGDEDRESRNFCFSEHGNDGLFYHET